MKPAMAEYADKLVLCIGGPKDAARKVGESYGLRKAVLPHDIIHWNRSIWDRYKFGPADEELVRVRLLGVSQLKLTPARRRLHHHADQRDLRGARLLRLGPRHVDHQRADAV